MAKLYFDGVCVMHDVVANVKQAFLSDLSIKTW